MASIKVSGVKWDEAEDLSSEVKLEIGTSKLMEMDEMELEDYVSDALSDTYGFCHFGWEEHTIEATIEKKRIS